MKRRTLRNMQDNLYLNEQKIPYFMNMSHKIQEACN